MGHHPRNALPDAARRTFLRGSLATAAASAGGLAAAGCDSQPHDSMSATASLIADGATVLFQGDSITDASRRREPEHASTANRQPGLGHGYAWLAAAGLLLRPGTRSVRVFNRGISGNKVFQLAERWQQDCLSLRPDVLSILIGVNDIWHTLGGQYDGTVERYERDYDALLRRTREALPATALVVCEPFVLRCGSVDDTWFPEFDDYRERARRVAERHGARFVAFQSMFDAATAWAPPEHWAKDGVHPSAAGAALMAQTWLATVTGS